MYKSTIIANSIDRRRHGITRHFHYGDFKIRYTAIRLPDDLLIRLREQADTLNLPVSTYIRFALAANINTIPNLTATPHDPS